MTKIITYFPRGFLLSHGAEAESANSNAPCGLRDTAHSSAAKLCRRHRRIYPLPIGTVGGLGRRAWLRDAAGIALCAAAVVVALIIF